MKDKRDNLDLEIEQLLLQKSYENLSATELTLVATQFTAEEYHTYRLLLLESKKVFAQKQTYPRPEVRKHLTHLVRSKKEKAKVWTNLDAILHYRIPAWPAALGFMALLFFAWPNAEKGITQTPEPEKVYVYKTDTVYKDKPVFVHQPTAPVKHAPRTAKAEVPAPKKYQRRNTNPTIQRRVPAQKVLTQPSESLMTEALVSETLALNLDTVMLNKSASGRSVEQEKDLMDFFVEMY